MTRDDLRITAHAAIRMAERMIDSEDVILVLLTGEVIESWTAWIDQEVAVDPSGQVFWPAWILGLSTSENGQSGDGTRRGVHVEAGGRARDEPQQQARRGAPAQRGIPHRHGPAVTHRLAPSAG